MAPIFGFTWSIREPQLRGGGVADDAWAFLINIPAVRGFPESWPGPDVLLACRFSVALYEVRGVGLKIVPISS